MSNSAALQQRRTQLQEILTQTQRSCERLRNALSDERDALRSNDTVQLDAAVGRKKLHLADLEKLEQRRRALLAACKLKDDLPAMQRFVTSSDADGSLTKLWQATMEMVAECRDTNNTNGAIIAAQRQHNSKTLGVLRDQPEAPETYGPEGKTETTGQYRALAEV